MSEPTGPGKPRSTKGSATANQQASAADPRASSTPPVPPPSMTDPAPGSGASETPTSGIPAATQPMTPIGAVPGFSEAVPGGPPPAGPPSGRPPVGPPGGPVWPAAGGPAGPPPRRPGLWRQATSTTGGLIAVIVAAALTTLLVLGTVGAVGLFAVRAAHHDGNARIERAGMDGPGLPPGQQRKLDRMPQGPGAPGRQGNGPGDDQNDGDGPDGLGGQGGPGGMGNGMGGLMRGAMGLGAVQHGEFTVQQNGTAVVMTVQRGTVTKASATSVTVKSDDNFTATYTLGTDTRGRTGALAVGDSVLVVAEKDGAKAVLVTAARKG